MTIIYILVSLLLIIGVFYLAQQIKSNLETRRFMGLLGSEAPTLEQDGIQFRDLNKNGKLDIYEDPRRPIEERVQDLLSQMTLEEKAGMLFHAALNVSKDGTLSEKKNLLSRIKTSEAVASKKLNHFNLMGTPKPRLLAEWHNRLQKLAERTRLGIPVTISTDPRHHFTNNPATSFLATHFSAWPEPSGLAAIDDEKLVQEFADIARQEYLAVGIRIGLHPQIDLATEPRWTRVNGTFGEDAELTSKMVKAYIRGFQGEKLGPQSIACMTKHFPGGGPQKDGEDPHFEYGREQVYPGNNFDYHLKPFEAAFEAGTSQIMPYYGMPVGTQYEEKGFSFNKSVITGLLREKYGFDGVVCTDWGLVSDANLFGLISFPARAWGVEHLSVPERAQLILEAGVDQFGGEFIPEVIVDLVRGGKLSESRIDVSVRRLLKEKFVMGLFDQPYIDPDLAEQTVGRADFKAAGLLAQRKSIVLLKNDSKALPLKPGKKIYVEGIKKEIASQYGTVVSKPEDADFAILRLQAPYEKRKGIIERFMHAGDLDFKGKQKEHILDILKRVPTVVDIYLDRPAVIPEIAEKCAGLVANFGCEDAAVLDVIFGKFNPGGKLPFEMPSSMEAVRKQKEDVPYDSENPLFPFGYGLRYS
jgi:beta-glucosidase